MTRPDKLIITYLLNYIHPAGRVDFFILGVKSRTRSVFVSYARMSQDLSFPLRFSGAAQLQLFTRYGDPEDPGFAAKWIVHWDVHASFPWFPAGEVYLHKHFKPALDAAFLSLEMAGLHAEVRSFDGGYELRRVRGSSDVMSTHSWGCAIDLNAALNPLGSEGKWSKAFLDIMQEHKICCGQLWSGRKDPMHFALVNG